ncbi:MAG: FG-GAP-like repeat-containing protein [Terracidiphilus sp.]
MAAADFNRDGKLDLAYITSGDSIYAGPSLHILLGHGDGSFSPGLTIPLPTQFCACAINIADMNNDGIPDIVLGPAGESLVLGAVAVLLGNGDGSFRAPIVSWFRPNEGFGSVSICAQMGIGDLNGDGNLDLVILTPGTDEIYVLTGDGKGSITTANLIGDPYQTVVQTILADLNNDGKLDLVAPTASGGVVVHMGLGNAKFSNGVQYNFPLASHNVVVTDLNHDGHLDVAASTYTVNSSAGTISYQVSMLPGKGDGTFGPMVTVLGGTPRGSNLIAVEDLNGDGHPDLLLLTDQGVRIYYGQAGGTFSAPADLVAVPAGYDAVAQGKFTATGTPGLAMGVGGGILLLADLAHGATSGPALYDVGHPVQAITVADFNGDGRPDIAAGVAAEYPRVLMGKGDGSFTLLADQNASYPSGYKPSAVMAAGNFAGNGRVSLVDGPFRVGTTTDSYEYMLPGNGDATFGSPEQLTTVPSYSAIADLNRDGLPDFLELTNGSTINPATLTAYLATGGGGYNPVTTTLRQSLCWLVAVGDLNGDGIPDVVLYCGDIEVWLGTGTGSFRLASTLTLPGNLDATPFTQYNSQPAVIADIDGDGKADLAMVDGGLAIFWGDGKGGLGAPVSYPTSRSYTNVAAADVNRDGRTDLVLNDSNGIAVLLNQGNRSFAAEQHLVAGSKLGPVSLADLNHDGYPDIVVANVLDSTVAVLLNRGTGASGPLSTATGKIAVTPATGSMGQPFQIRVTLAAPQAGGPTPTGKVDLYFAQEYLGAFSLANGAAILSLSGTPTAAPYPGSYTVEAAYRGDSHYTQAIYATTYMLNEPVLPTTTTLKSSSQSLLTSQTLHLTATVSSTTTTPTGSVAFRDGSTRLGSATLNAAGIAVFDTNLLSAGSHTLIAAYSGRPINNRYSVPGYAASISAGVPVTVSSHATTTSLAVSSTAPAAGALETLTATVTSASGTPFGSVAFYDGSALLGVSSLRKGKAAWSTASLAVGAHTLTAVYRANGTFAGSNSAARTVTVSAARSTQQAR